MADHDRGAYTPHAEEPLAFDPRRAGERRPLPMALIASALILVGLIGGVALVYRGGVRRADEGPRPVGQPTMSVKTAPVPAAQPQTADEDADIYARNPPGAQPSPAPAANVTGAAPTFAPPPEQPAPRPAPRPAAIATVAPPPAQPLAAQPDKAEVAAVGDATRPPAKVASASPPVSTPSGPEPAAAEPAAASDAAGDAGPVVQIGAFSSASLADKGYAAVIAAMPGRMGGKAKHVQPIQHSGSTLYRTWISGFGSRIDAEAFCESLKAHSLTCIVKG